MTLTANSISKQKGLDVVPMKLYHVLAETHNAKVQMLFSDLNLAELAEQFVRPYKRGKTFFCRI